MRAALRQELEGLVLPETQWHYDADLGKWSYLQIGAKVPYLAVVKSETDLLTLTKFLLKKKVEYYVFGGLSNTLFAKENFAGVVILYRVVGPPQLHHDTLLTASAGTLMSQAANLSIESGLFGLAEFISLPGTVGGAVYGDAHYDGLLISQYLIDLKVFLPGKNKLEHLRCSEFDSSAAYRSHLKDTQAIILEATWELKPDHQTKLREQAVNATTKRQISQPLDLPSLGCFWQNPRNISAGFLIDKAGLKGKKCGGVEVSSKHAAFIVKTGPATAADVLKLAAQVKTAVKKFHQIDLEPEVVIIK